MKNLFALVSLLTLSLFSGNIYCQTNSAEKKVIVSFSWSRIQTHGSNQLAAWVEDTSGSYIKTIYATRFTTTGGFVRRSAALSEWVEKSGLKNASKDEIDAITGSTFLSGKQSLTWDCKDKSGSPVPDGKYIIRMEANIQDTNKMYFKGLIRLGAGNQVNSGEISFSRPELVSGNVLFKDVILEYKE